MLIRVGFIRRPMRNLWSFMIRGVLFCLFIGLSVISSGAEPIVSFVDDKVIICLGNQQDETPVNKNGADCKETTFAELDPQGTQIWAFFNIYISDRLLESYEPLGLGVSAKASSWIYLNGREVGRNGLPSQMRETEKPGRMDVVFPLREGALKAGKNEIALRLSSHHGVLKLDRPVHRIYIAPYERQQSRRLLNYAPSLLPFGVFIIGALYFAIMSVVGRRRIEFGLLSLMSVTVAIQLFIEVSRGLFAYAYPVHDMRLIGIVFCSAIFAMLLSIYVVRVFGLTHQRQWYLLIGVTLILSILLPENFDVKALAVLLSQTALGLLIALSNVKESPRKAMAFLFVLLAFASVNIFGKGLFLDTYFFFSIALLMLFLFAQQALAYGQEQWLRKEEEIRANKLQLVLDKRQEESEPVILSLAEAGKIHRIPADDILSISGAGDYVEIMYESGKVQLISATLTELEAQLPSFFIRVHRSHIVNTNYIKNLEREASGTGKLHLKGDKTLPVSRRIMPVVRKALI